MYLEYFGLSKLPFSIAPDPSFLFLSPRHREALAHMRHGLSGSGGFLLLTGEVGLGKTTISRAVLSELEQDLDVTYILNPRLGEREMLLAIAEGFGVEAASDASTKWLTDHLADYLKDSAARDIHPVVVIDEAQHLLPSVLEQLRLLTNLETDSRKLLSIVLIGQPELKLLLQRPDLRQVAQRVVARYQLMPFSESEVNEYIEHRVGMVGGSPALFTKRARKAIFQFTQGTPRLINLICDRALQIAAGKSKPQVDVECVRAATDVLPSEYNSEQRQTKKWAVIAVFIIVLCVVAYSVWRAMNPIVDTPVEHRSQNQNQESLSATEVTPELQIEGADFNSGVAALMQLWGIQGESIDASLCESLEYLNLYCLRTELNLNEIKALDIPVLIQLSGGNLEQFVLLSHVEGDDWTLIDVEGTKTVTQQTLTTISQQQIFALYHVTAAQGSSAEWRRWVMEHARAFLPYSIRESSFDTKKAWLSERLRVKTEDDSWLLALLSSRDEDIERPSLTTSTENDTLLTGSEFKLAPLVNESGDSQVFFPEPELNLADLEVPEQKIDWDNVESTSTRPENISQGTSQSEEVNTSTQLQPEQSIGNEEEISDALQLLFDDAVRSTPPVESDYREQTQEQFESSEEQSNQRRAEQDSENLPTLGQIPTSIRRQIPPTSYDSHVYHSFASERFIELNAQRYAEGDSVNGMRIISIQPAYSIVEFRGLMFKLDALENVSSQ